MPRNRVMSFRGGATVAVAFQLLLFAGASLADDRVGPAKIEKIEGTDQKRVILTPRAAERLGIKTTPVREGKVLRRIVVLADVQEESPANIMNDATDASAPIGTSEPVEMDRSSFGDIRVRLLLDRNPADDAEDDVSDSDDEDDAEIVSSGNDDDLDDDDETPIRVRRVPGPDTAGPNTLYFKVKDRTLGLEPGQHIAVRIVEPGSEMTKRIIPYSAVLYDVNGDTWVYTNPEPLVFVKERVAIDRIDQGMAVLKGELAVGTSVVTVGGAELLGAETGVGH
jgi:hypothetical protein